jgi:hydroxymethylpyrimidine/phosphomethylpyrimidine kinase
MARASVSTPNLDELQAICGMVAGEAIAIADAARRLIEDRGSGPILVTGVRSSGAAIIPTDGSAMATGDLLFDLLYHRGDRGPSQQWYAERIETDDDHGTGCTLSSAIAVGLGRGLPLGQAIDQARIYVRAALKASPGLGHGHGPMGHGLGRTWFGDN